MGPTLVVKCGGHEAVDADAVCRDVAGLIRHGWRVVLVHGGSGEIERLAARLGVPQRVQVAPDGVPSRYTDGPTLEVVTLALAGSVKPGLVAALSRVGVRAVGLTGLDADLVTARRKAVQHALVDGRRLLIRDNHAGTVQAVDAGLLRVLLGQELVPVLSPPARGGDGAPLNVNADRMAAAVAAALSAACLVFLTGASGLLRDPADESTVLAAAELDRTGPAAPGVGGGMALKLIAAREALLGGVGDVRIADGRCSGPVTAALAGAGTRATLGHRAAALS
ncbi:MAG: [LysW]-aminoadipate kinase [Micromonosporaceae bacterium]